MHPATVAKILIVDDDPDIREIYGEVLHSDGFLVDFAKDGGEGYDKILAGGYDLVLLDIMMPKIDGLDILKRLKASPPTVYNGPIIVLTQLNQDQILHQAIEYGAKGYLIKADLTPDQVLEKVTQLLQSPSNLSS